MERILLCKGWADGPAQNRRWQPDFPNRRKYKVSTTFRIIS